MGGNDWNWFHFITVEIEKRLCVKLDFHSNNFKLELRGLARPWNDTLFSRLI